MYTSGGSAATRVCGWGMVVSAGAAVGCALAGVSPYPPLLAELVLAGVAAVFAVAWVVASYRIGDRDLFEEPARKPRRPNGALPYVFAAGIPLASMAAFLTVFTPSTERGQWEERMERAGYGAYTVSVVRPVGKPTLVPESPDNDAYYLTDVVVRVPFTAGPREVVVEQMFSRPEPLAPGAEVEVYYAPGSPGEPVTEDDRIDGMGMFYSFALAIWVWPWLIIAGAIMKGYMETSDLHRLRRFSPGIHLPALGVLFTGLVLLLPMALGFQVASFDQLPALLASFTPVLALTWVVRAS
ncbi:hypothetical protein [Streptomyces sp. NPDC058486]|uniref:hypothetical protein n=1 Tax=unclassified Streptomyces TaxID=2593676 RepID=UPI00365B42A5